MLSTAQLVGFCATTKSEAAKAFYGDVLGLRLTEETPFALVFDTNGTVLRLQKVAAFNPAPHTALGWDVADIRAEIDILAGKGVAFVRYDGLDQDERGIWQPVAGVSVAWFKDPDGNLLSLSEQA